MSPESIVAVLLVACGGYITSGVLRTWRQGHKAYSWPTADGEILRSQFREKGWPFRTRYMADVRYRYRVGDVDYEGAQLAFRYEDKEHDTKERPQGEVKRYHAGQKVDVYHDPKDPQIAVLEPGSPVLLLSMQLVAGLWMAAFGVIIWLRYS